MTSLAVAIDLLAPRLVPELASEENLRVIEEIAARFPARFANCFGFETRLEEQRNEVDFAIDVSHPGLDVLERFDDWPRLQTFAKQWGSSEADRVANRSLWLEFDTASQAKMPNAFIGFECPGAPIEPARWLAAEIIPQLLGRPLDARIEGHLLRCFDFLPASMRRLQLGLLLSRPVDALRLCAIDMPRLEIGPYLDRIGWLGPRSTVDALLNRYASFADYLNVHIDVGKAIFPTFGVELLFRRDHPWNHQPAFVPIWFDLFDQLVAEGLCLPWKRDALLAWPVQLEASHGDAVVGLHYIKLTIDLAGAIKAKGYFGAYYVERAH